jgi:phosphate transport system substrate-binding protein
MIQPRPRFLAPLIALLLSLAISALPARAQDGGSQVILEDLNGGARITGELRSYDGQTLDVMTQFGLVALDAARVRCIGDACPQETSAQNIYRIAAPQMVAANMMADILAGFGATHSLDVVRVVSSDGKNGYQIGHVGDERLSWTLQTGDTRAIVDGLLSGTVDLALTFGLTTPTERGQFKGRGRGDLSSAKNVIPLAIAPLVAVISPQNGLTEMSEDRLARVLTGDITDWREFGVDGGAITIYLSASNDMASEIVRRNQRSPARVGNTVTYLDDDTAVADAVAGDPSGLGFVALPSLRAARKLSLTDTCGNLMAADVFSAKSGAYPYANRLRALRATPVDTASAAAFWDYLGSDDILPVLDYAGFSDMRAERRSTSDLGARLVTAISAPQTEVTLPRLRSMMTILQGAQQFSTTFRLRPGRTRLDDVTRENLDALLAEIGRLRAQVGPDLREIIIAGFTDSIGVAESNEEKSLGDANLVRDLLQERGGTLFDGLTISVHGFGEISPLICNDTEANRAMNRRVEIWVR